MITADGISTCEFCFSDTGEFNQDGNHPLCEENAHLRYRILEVLTGLDRAIEVIRQWHGLGFNRSAEKEVWSLYQNSPEMLAINQARAGDGEGEVDVDKFLQAVIGLVQYRDQAGPLNFQLEKADSFLFVIRNTLPGIGKSNR